MLRDRELPLTDRERELLRQLEKRRLFFSNKGMARQAAAISECLEIVREWMLEPALLTRRVDIELP